VGLLWGVLLYMDFHQQEGRIAEAILTEYFLRLGYYVFAPMAAYGPIDLVVVNPETREVVLLDAKKNHERTKGWQGRAPNHRIHRMRTPIQKKLGVIIQVDVWSPKQTAVPLPPVPFAGSRFGMLVRDTNKNM
jgi:hypothetical protein